MAKAGIAKKCFIAWKTINTFILNHAAGAFIICLVVMFIFYYTASEGQEYSAEINLHFYEDKYAHGGRESTGMQNNDLEYKKTYKIDSHGLVSGHCEYLYKIARNMLDGERIKLPFETKHTKWKFRKAGSMDLLNKTFLRWNYPWANNSVATRRYLMAYSKVKSKDIKVKKYFITFASNCCNKSKIKALNSARYPGGFDFTAAHNLKSFSKGFHRARKSILQQRRGSGFWLWKPYIILKTLVENMEDGDLVMYQDAGAYLIADAGPLLKLCQDSKFGVLIFESIHPEKLYSKRDAFILMGMDDSRVFNTPQRVASYVVVRRNCDSLQFLMEWLAYASEPRILTDMDNTMGRKNLRGFLDNRHDQTVLSLLSKKWEMYALRDPSQHGEILEKFKYAAGPYKQLIVHTRDKN